MSEALEITTLRPAAGLTTADFVAANADINVCSTSRDSLRPEHPTVSVAVVRGVLDKELEEP